MGWEFDAICVGVDDGDDFEWAIPSIIEDGGRCHGECAEGCFVDEYEITNVKVAWFALGCGFLHVVACAQEVLMGGFEYGALVVEELG